jgi:hypothetical protein
MCKALLLEDGLHALEVVKAGSCLGLLGLFVAADQDRVLGRYGDLGKGLADVRYAFLECALLIEELVAGLIE